jgi:hypothetical protein
MLECGTQVGVRVVRLNSHSFFDEFDFFVYG